MKVRQLAALTMMALASASIANESAYQPIGWRFNDDGQGPLALPRQFRNHCAFDVARGRYYCSDHCGSDYQFYYCTKKSFGCCHVGHGYCGSDNVLRCRP
jgi:hypothetical protein